VISKHPPLEKMFLAMRGTAAPFKPHKQKGHIPSSGNPLMYFLVGGHAEKVVTFLTTFLQQKKTSVRGLNKAFFHHLRQ
jgi:hypothetical protein